MTARGRKQRENRVYCTWCGKVIPGFRDRLSVREFQISGMCQKCQDETFGRCHEGCGHPGCKDNEQGQE
jgi:hypothetical protein